jgi:signal transduction histidine kinase/CheY-like chemotaxis protein
MGHARRSDDRSGGAVIVMPRTLRAQLVGLIAALVGVISVFMFLYFPAQLKREAVQDLLARAQAIGRITAFSVSPAVVRHDVAGLEAALAGALQNADLRFIVARDSAGAIVGGYNVPAAKGTAPVPASSPAARAVVRDSSAIVSVPIEANGRTIGRLEVGMSLGSVRAQVGRARGTIALVSLLVFVAGVLAVVAISTVLTRPLAAIVTAVEAIAGGDRSQRAPASGSEEVGHLAGAFNRMLDSLDSVQRQLEEANRMLEVRVAERTQELEQARGELLQAQKMEAVGQLAGGVAHDFNNLLTVIIGNTDLGLDALPPDAAARADLKEVLEAANRGKALAQQLLAFGRKQILRSRVVDLNALVGNAHLLLRRLIGEDIELRLVAGPRLAPVRADVVQLQQVIMNLAINARDAMPRGGILTIETGNVEVDAAFARAHRPMPSGAWVLLAIRDNGVGMSERVREHLFEPFFTTKALGKGTGLGLATVYGIVKQSGGYVWVNSSPGAGAEFRIYLPPVAAEPDGEPVEVEAPPVGGLETILVVEDEPSVRKLACRVLAARGYAIIAADSGRQALEMVERHHGVIDCLVTDVVMPGMSGLELAKLLAARIPGLKVLVTSGYAADVAHSPGGAFADADYLPKPYTADELSRAVRTTLDAARVA